MQEDKELLSAIKELTHLIKTTEEPRQCRASPYKFQFVLDWRSILAIAVSALAIIDKVIDKIMN